MSGVVYRLKAFTSIQDLKRYEEPIPNIDRHEVLINIKAVSLNYRDIAIANGTYPFSVKDRVVPCSDGAGEIVAVGDSVVDLKVGDLVVGVFNITHLYGPQLTFGHALGGTIDGVLREYVVLPEQSVTKIPRNTSLSFPQMASLVCTGVTAWNALFGYHPLRPGQIVLFQGTGGVSMSGLVLAKAAGAVTIVTSSSDSKLEFVKQKYGADYVINYKKTPHWAKEALEITKGRGVDLVFDNGGSGTIGQSLECIAWGGTVAVIGFLSPADKTNMPDVAALALSKGCVVRGVLVGSKQLLEELVTFVVNKDIRIPVDKVFGFTEEEVLDAFGYLGKGGHIGKVCISLE